MSRQALALAIETSPGNVRRMEECDGITPNLVHAAIAPSDYALPLLRWAAEKHSQQLLAAPAVDADRDAVIGEARIACLDLLRAFESPSERRCELESRAALRVANAARAVLELVRRERGV